MWKASSGFLFSALTFGVEHLLSRDFSVTRIFLMGSHERIWMHRRGLGSLLARLISTANRQLEKAQRRLAARVSARVAWQRVRATCSMSLTSACAEAPGLHTTDCRTGKGLASDPTQTDLVVFHKDCIDGFAAAFAAWRLLGDRATYVAAEHGPAAPLHLDVRDRRVVVLDYCFPAAVTSRMISEAASFLVLDHHASAEKELTGVPQQHKVFEMKQSGATLAWDYFHGPAPAPPLFRYIEDKDIWRWALPGSQEFTAGFSPGLTLPESLPEWDAMLSGGEPAMREAIRSGSAVLQYRCRVRDEHVARAVPCVLRAAPSLRGMLVNATTLASEIGNALATQPGVDYALMWQRRHAPSASGDGSSYVCSLRSATDAVDVSIIAAAHGGGGHRRAAGFTHTGQAIEELFLSVGGRVIPGATDAAAGPERLHD